MRLSAAHPVPPGPVGWRSRKDAAITVEVFTLHSGENSVEVSLDKVYGFPDHTSPFGGYDALGVLTIHCGAYHVHGPLAFSTAAVWQFYTRLRTAYDALTGQAGFRSSEGNLDVTLRFTARGHWMLEGMYQEYLHAPTRLVFALEGDQTYLKDTLAQLGAFAATYGDSRGRHE